MADPPPEQPPDSTTTDQLPPALTPDPDTFTAVTRERDVNESDLIAYIIRVQQYWTEQVTHLWETGTVHVATDEGWYFSVPLGQWQDLSDALELHAHEWLAVRDVHTALLETVVNEYEISGVDHIDRDETTPVVLATAPPATEDPSVSPHTSSEILGVEVADDDAARRSTWAVMFGATSMNYGFRASATARVPGDVGKLHIEREYYAQPRAAEAETETAPDALRVETSGRLFLTDTRLPETTKMVDLAAPPRELDRPLTAIVVDHHTAHLAPVYQRAQEKVPQCASCGTPPVPADGVEIHEIVPLDSPLCPTCFAEKLTAKTLLSQREAAVYARRHHGQSYTTIANHLDVTRSTVRSYLTRATCKQQEAAQTVALLGIPDDAEFILDSSLQTDDAGHPDIATTSERKLGTKAETETGTETDTEDAVDTTSRDDFDFGVSQPHDHSKS